MLLDQYPHQTFWVWRLTVKTSPFLIFEEKWQNYASGPKSAPNSNSLKPNVANVPLFNFCEQKFIQHGPIAACSGLSLFIFEEKWSNYASGPISAPNILVVSAFQYMRAGFLCPKCDYFVCLHTRQDRNDLHLKLFFFLPKSASSLSWSQAHLTQRIHNHIRSAEE